MSIRNFFFGNFPASAGLPVVRYAFCEEDCQWWFIWIILELSTLVHKFANVFGKDRDSSLCSEWHGLSSWGVPTSGESGRRRISDTIEYVSIFTPIYTKHGRNWCILRRTQNVRDYLEHRHI